jgi:hypothetical protein
MGKNSKYNWNESAVIQGRIDREATAFLFVLHKKF